MKTIHDPRYAQLIGLLRKARKIRGISQVELAKKLGQPQSYVAKVERMERRLDLIELHDWLKGLDYGTFNFLRDVGWLENHDTG